MIFPLVSAVPVFNRDIQPNITNRPAHIDAVPESCEAPAKDGEKFMPRLVIRIAFEDRGGLGPGKAELLELIEKTGSIRAAAASMDMSYRRAWLLMKETENMFGAPILARSTGGKNGGGAALNELGRSIVKSYRKIEKTAAQALAKDLAALYKMVRSS